jgi:hypothetical protein
MCPTVAPCPDRRQKPPNMLRLQVWVVAATGSMIVTPQTDTFLKSRSELDHNFVNGNGLRQCGYLLAGISNATALSNGGVAVVQSLSGPQSSEPVIHG